MMPMRLPTPMAAAFLLLQILTATAFSFSFSGRFFGDLLGWEGEGRGELSLIPLLLEEQLELGMLL